MKTYIALLRGINVGGKNNLPMKELVAVLDDLGSRNVQTYIQSGNAVFENKENDRTRLLTGIRSAIKQRRGFDPHVLMLEPEDIQRAIRQNPFSEAEIEPQTLHVSFLASAPEKANLKALESLMRDRERFHLIGNAFYLHAPEGVGRSRLAANVEKVLGVPMTDRNWRTVCKLWEMAKGAR